MFQEGDKVVYPLYGAGIIESLEQKEIDGQDKTYYVLRIPVTNLKVMVSVQKAEGMGVRRVLDIAELLTAFASVRVLPVKMSDNWNQRYKDNWEKIKTGEINEVAEVYRNLRIRERKRGLSSVEKKMLQTVKQILLSEIIISNGAEKSTAEEMLEQSFCSTVGVD